MPVHARFARGFDYANGKDAMYFDIKDSFFNGKPLDGEYPVTVRVVYFDIGSGKWAMQYAAVGEPNKTAYVVTRTNTGTWKERTVTLHDARFGNRGPHGADLMLVNNATFHKSSDTWTRSVRTLELEADAAGDAVRIVV